MMAKVRAQLRRWLYRHCLDVFWQARRDTRPVACPECGNHNNWHVPANWM